MSDGIKRRDFLKVLGVSGAGAGLVGCSTDHVEQLLPYVVGPEDITPGVATWYTSVCGECSAGCGVWVRTREGRAVKVEGNPNHPVSAGGLCARGQSSVQGIYDPDRFAGPMIREGDALREATWEEAEQRLTAGLRNAAGDILYLTGALGPSLSDLVDQFVSVVGGTRVEHEALSSASLREATRLAFGASVVPRFDFEAARFVVSFGADFLETWLSPVEFARGFARASGERDGRKGELAFVGPRLSLTGQNADEWLPIRPGTEAAVALAMAAHIAGDDPGAAGPYAPVLAEYDVDGAASVAGVDAEAIRSLAERFVGQGPSLALPPGLAGQHRNATASALATLILNQVAGNVGRTVLVDGGMTSVAARPYSEMESAIRSMAGGSVGVAVVHGTNPAHSLPPASGFADAFRGVGFKVVFAAGPDETTAMADLVLPDRHFLEAWGDSIPRPGVYALQQPVMQPVPHFDSRPAGDVLLSAARQLENDLGAPTFHDYVRNRWGQLHAAAEVDEPFDAWWRGVLRRGVVELPVEPSSGEAVLRSPDMALTFDTPELDGDGDFTLVAYPSARLGDGSLANRPWLMELPDPVSKLAWQSWVEMHPTSADRLGLEDGDVVRVSSPHGEVVAPLLTYPGIREDTVAMSMGLGHEGMGRFADGNGVNVMRLLPAVAEQPSGSLVTLATRVRVEATGEHRRLATIAGADTQHDRNIAPAVSLASLGAPEGAEGGEQHGELKELQAGGGFVPVDAEDDPEAYPLPGSRYGAYGDPETPRWGMAIDLDKCTGCSACVTACQAENNVPWVGQDAVTMGRDMHWIRLERYFETVDASHAGPVDVRHLPMLCQQCGNAPCEPVCPVFAAYHTPDGLNGQVYNRCVGTRYCANNCPYKVRVFNWYTYTNVPEPMYWQYNPDVTVRENGVMEKCSFCVQRIRESQNRASLEGRTVGSDEVVPACQQTCPAEAIVFGNLRDPASRVSQVSGNRRTYRVLNEMLNTQPAVSYLKKVTLHDVAGVEH